MANKQAINPERRRRRYSKEFKIEAVRQLELGQKPATQLALELGVARNRLYKWQVQLRSGKPMHAAPGRPKLSEENELSRLRRELKRVSEDLDILKKAQAYFAKRRG
jgi:transposase